DGVSVADEEVSNTDAADSRDEAGRAPLSSGTAADGVPEEIADEAVMTEPQNVTEERNAAVPDTTSHSPATEQSRKPVRRRGIRLYGSIATSLAFQKMTPFANDGVRIESFYSRPVLSTGRVGLSLQAGIQHQVGRRVEMY